MKLTDEQWDSLGVRNLSPSMSKDDIKKVLSVMGIDYDDEDVDDIFSVVNFEALDSDIEDMTNIKGTPDNPVTKVTEIDKDEDGDTDITITEQEDGKDKKQKKQKSERLPGGITPEEMKMLSVAKGNSGKFKPETSEEKNMINSFANILKDYRY